MNLNKYMYPLFFVIMLILIVSCQSTIWAKDHIKISHEYLTDKTDSFNSVKSTSVVQTELGKITGIIRKDYPDIRAFLGIPYASPPVGQLRWKAPKKAKKWKGIRKCNHFGPSCPQPSSLLLATQGPFSEDCLYLNIWAPRTENKKDLPVMVWIHGGGLTTGSGSKEIYQGWKLASKAIVVTINYRLGPFGFMAHPLLSRESAKRVSGNYGLLDQIAALKWVKRNISAFGGNPHNVTIFGESAGALSVSCLLVSPLSKGYFQRAICQSGTALGIRTYLKKIPADNANQTGTKTMEQVGQEIVKRLGIKGGDLLKKLRKVSAEKILVASQPRVGLFGKGIKFGPCVDGYVLPDIPERLYATGKFHDVPLMIGTNADEGSVFIRKQMPIQKLAGYYFVLSKIYGKDNVRKIIRLYPVHSSKDIAWQLSRIITDSVFITNARLMAHYFVQKAKSPLYMYHFTRVCKAAQITGIGAAHGIEIFYLFGSNSKHMGFTNADYTLSNYMRQAWWNFARNGNPDGPRLVHWQKFTNNRDNYLQLGDNIKMKSDMRKFNCDFFEKIHKRRFRIVPDNDISFISDSWKIPAQLQTLPRYFPEVHLAVYCEQC